MGRCGRATAASARLRPPPGGFRPPAQGHLPAERPRPSHPPLFVNSALAAAPLPLTRPPLSGLYLHNPASPCYDWLITSSLLRVGGTPEGQGWAALTR